MAKCYFHCRYYSTGLKVEQDETTVANSLGLIFHNFQQLENGLFLPEFLFAEICKILDLT